MTDTPKTPPSAKKKKRSRLYTALIITGMLICGGILILPFFTKMQERIITIQTAEGELHAFYALVADNRLKRAKGLQDVTQMPEDTGMIFVFDEAARHSMWMKNTHIPLDMLFIADNTVTHIARNAEPFSEEVLSPPSPVTLILEINGGLADTLGIREGDAVY